MDRGDLVEVLYSDNVDGPRGEGANVVDGLYEIGKALRLLGNGNAATSIGGLEGLGMAFKEGCSEVAGALRELADAVSHAR